MASTPARKHAAFMLDATLLQANEEIIFACRGSTDSSSAFFFWKFSCSITTGLPAAFASPAISTAASPISALA